MGAGCTLLRRLRVLGPDGADDSRVLLFSKGVHLKASGGASGDLLTSGRGLWSCSRALELAGKALHRKAAWLHVSGCEMKALQMTWPYGEHAAAEVS